MCIRDSAQAGGQAQHGGFQHAAHAVALGRRGLNGALHGLCLHAGKRRKRHCPQRAQLARQRLAAGGKGLVLHAGALHQVCANHHAPFLQHLL